MMARSVAGGLVALVACTGQSVDLGGIATDAAASSANSDSGRASDGLSGTYKGYVENIRFLDGSSTVRMTLALASDGTVAGTVYFGDGPPIAPPTDPNVGYPPGPLTLDQEGYVEGFDFAVVEGRYGAPGVTFSIQWTEAWKQWCGLQAPYLVQSTVYSSDGGIACGALKEVSCLPSVGDGTMDPVVGCSWTSCDSPMPTPVDCGKYLLCTSTNVCACSYVAGCTSRSTSDVDIGFDLQLSPNQLNGLMGTFGGGSVTVHLTKQ